MKSFRTFRLLVVEDNSAFLYLIQRAFAQREGRIPWKLTVAEDGESALDILFANEAGSVPLPDIVLLDWNLSKVNGKEVLRRIKDHTNLRRLPVLVFSSSEADKDIDAAYDGHANGYITKPTTLEELAATVEAVENFWTSVARLPRVVRRM